MSAQYTGRTEFLSELIDKMSSDTRFAIEEIEQLWFEHKREMIESSKIVKFNRNVLMADGHQAEMEVVRIGTYNLVSDGKYLEYSPETGLVSELARQPSGYSGGADLQSADSGFKAGRSRGPLGGGLLKALINTPTLYERWQFGGIVGLIITIVFFIAIILAITRFVILHQKLNPSYGLNKQ